MFFFGCRILINKGIDRGGKIIVGRQDENKENEEERTGEIV